MWISYIHSRWVSIPLTFHIPTIWQKTRKLLFRQYFFFTFQFRSTCAGLRHFTPLCTRLFPKFWIPTVILKWIFQNCSVLSLFSVYKTDIRAYCGSLLAKRSEAPKIKVFLIGLSEVIQLHSVIGSNRTGCVLFHSGRRYSNQTQQSRFGLQECSRA